MIAKSFKTEKEAQSFKQSHEIIMYCHLAGTNTRDIVYKETIHD
ncbi:unnamed protein product [Fructobacillus fructosus]|nr:unnamed protein product [Fructobacillus fructosus]